MRSPTQLHIPLRPFNKSVRSCTPLAAACALLSVFLLGAAEARAQWTTPDTSGNINNTNIGNVGVGTSAPSGKLDVTTTGTSTGGIDFIAKDSVATNAYPFIISHRIGTSSGTLTRLGFNAYAASSTIGLVNTAVGGWVMQSDSRDGLTAPSIQFISVNTSLTKNEVMTLQQGGNVGIGTNAPATLLHVFSTSNAPHAIVLDAQGTGSSQQSNIDFVTFGDGTKTTGYSTTRGWHMVARGNAYTTAAEQNDFGLYYWNGTSFNSAAYWDSLTGNMGLGTTSPLANLDMNGAHTANTPNFQIRNGTSTGRVRLWGDDFAGMELWKNGSPSAASFVGMNKPGTALTDDLLFSTYNSTTSWIERLRVLNSNGNVGIGTTNPTQKLDVAGNVNASGFCLTDGCRNTWAQVGGGSSQWANGASSSINYGSGNVGVGTVTPGARLDVGAGAAARGAYTDLLIGTGGNNAQMEFYGPTKSSAITHDETLGGIVFYTNGPAFAQSLFLSHAGNLGVGTTTPGRKLEVLAPDGEAARLYRNGATAGYGVNMMFAFNNSNGARIDYAGVHGILGNATAGAEGGHLIFTTTTNGALSEKVRIDSAGNLGVGTTNPGSKLFVGNGSAAVATLPGVNVALGGNSYISASNGTINTFFGSDTSTYGIVGTLSNHPLGLRANNTLAVTVMPSGNVGVGTTNPAAKLDVAGSINASGAITGATVSATYQDVAEWVPSTQKLSAGTVVVLDSGKTNHVVASASPYDTKVAGVISDSPGVILGVGGEGKLKVATTGRVKVRVDASRGAIQVGDLLVTSEVEGVAMKSVPVDLGGVSFHRPGTIIGKALEPLEKGTGEILVLLSLQ